MAERFWTVLGIDNQRTRWELEVGTYLGCLLASSVVLIWF
jgi:hypothetical protein